MTYAASEPPLALTDGEVGYVTAGLGLNEPPAPRCPFGHEDVLHVETDSGSPYPDCLECLSQPVPAEPSIGGGSGPPRCPAGHRLVEADTATSTVWVCPVCQVIVDLDEPRDHRGGSSR